MSSNTEIKQEDKSPVDLSNLFQLQRNYLVGLGRKSQDEDIDADVERVQDQLDELHKDFKAAEENSQSVLVKQGEVDNIVKTENKRLHNKKQQIDSAIDSQQRAILLNESKRLRQHEYNRMLYYVIFALLVVFLLVIIQKRVPFIPEWLVSVIVVFTFFYCGIMIFNIYNDVQRRSKMNFNELQLDQPVTMDEKRERELARGNLLGELSTGECQGPACCHPGTVFDKNKLQCVYDIQNISLISDPEGTSYIRYDIDLYSMDGKKQYEISDNQVFDLDGNVLAEIENDKLSNIIHDELETFSSFSKANKVVANSPNEYSNYSKI
jgi:predicted nucleic acid-binding Zn ribbon protein